MQCSVDDPTRFALLGAVDLLLATTLLSGVIWNFLWINFTTHGRQPELYILRCISSLVASVATIQLAVLILPRQVLIAGAAVYLCVSINATCWCSSLWLDFQAEGLASILPDALRLTLTATTPLAFLRDTALTDLVCRWFATSRQLLALTLLPESDLPMALSTLPDELRTCLLQPGLQVL